MKLQSGIRTLGLVATVAAASSCAVKSKPAFYDISRGSCIESGNTTQCSYNYDSGAVALSLESGKLRSQEVVDYLGATVTLLEIVSDEKSAEKSLASTNGTRLETFQDYNNFWTQRVYPFIEERQKSVSGMTLEQFVKYRASHKPKNFFVVVVEGSEAARYVQREASDRVYDIINTKNALGDKK